LSDLVLDASAAVYALTVLSPGATALRVRIRESTCHAPHLLVAEVGQVLRKRELTGDITPDQARTALRALEHLITEFYPHGGPLGEHAWALRGSITFYDALYVALAAGLNAPLVTTDRRLSRAPGLTCTVDAIG
jgi:predicted nucleic acid-binding protein